MGKNLSRLYTHNKILISLKTIFSLTLHYFICIWHHSISKQLVFRVSNWFYISRAFFIPNCILYLKNILYNSVFRAAQVFLVYIKTNWFIIIRVAQGFRVVQYFLDFSETQCCSKPCSLNPCSSRTHCSIYLQSTNIIFPQTFIHRSQSIPCRNFWCTTIFIPHIEARRYQSSVANHSPNHLHL